MWENFDNYQAEHRAAVARREEEERQRAGETQSADKEDVDAKTSFEG